MTRSAATIRRTGGVALRVLGAVLLFAAGVGAYFGWRVVQPEADDDGPRVVERKAPSVVTAIQSLARLESVAFHMERVVDLKSREQALWGLVQADDSILLVAAGDVVAGVDLNNLRAGDITLDETARHARILLPQPEVFMSRLDNQRTYVHSRQTDLLAGGGTNLETEARKRAEHAIHDSALKAGILEHARRNAAHTVRALAMSFGYDHVTVDWRTE